jgi:MoxR-like ATPase
MTAKEKTMSSMDSAVVDIAGAGRWHEWTVGQVFGMLCKAIETGFQRTIFIWGQRGIGKSAVVAQACQKAGAYLVDRRLSLLDPADVRGVMMPDKDATVLHLNTSQVGSLARWLLNPDFFPQTNGKRLVIFLDEFNHANDMCQKAAYELAWDHSIGGVKFPDGTVVILAGNRESENANVTPLDKPMRRRAIHCYLKFDFKSFWDYSETRLHPLVTAYHKENPGKVNQPIDNDLVEFYGEPLPASWEVVSDILRTFTRDEGSDRLIAGTIGVGAATEFTAWTDTAGKLTPLIDAIWNGADKTADELSQQFFVNQSLVERFRNLKPVERPKAASRILDYAEATKKEIAELNSVMIQTAKSVDWDALRKSDSYKKVMKSYYKVMV